MYESISKNNELETEITLDMSYFWYSDVVSFPNASGNFTNPSSSSYFASLKCKILATYSNAAVTVNCCPWAVCPLDSQFVTYKYNV